MDLLFYNAIKLIAHSVLATLFYSLPQLRNVDQKVKAVKDTESIV